MEATGYMLLDLARALAHVAHAGQSRKGSGEPYIEHPHRVARRVIGWRAKSIAWLHDVLEDTPLVEGDLLNIGFPRDLVDDVLTLTRRGGLRQPSDAIDGPTIRLVREPYFNFIRRTTRDGSNDALLVKLADVEDNLEDKSGWASDDLRARYLKADVMLRQAILSRNLPLPKPLAA